MSALVFGCLFHLVSVSLSGYFGVCVCVRLCVLVCGVSATVSAVVSVFVVCFGRLCANGVFVSVYAGARLYL